MTKKNKFIIMCFFVLLITLILTSLVSKFGRPGLDNASSPVEASSQQSYETWQSEEIYVNGSKLRHSVIYRLTDPEGNEYIILDNMDQIILLSKQEKK